MVLDSYLLIKEPEVVVGEKMDNIIQSEDHIYHFNIYWF